MKRIFTFAALLAVAVISLSAQSFSYKWQRVAMDTLYETNNISQIDKIIAKYSPGIEPLMEIVGYSSEEMMKKNPESGLSNFTADVLIYSAAPYLKEGDKVLALSNFGGIRSALPKGPIRKYDIYSVYPFDNMMVIVDIKGSSLRKIFNKFAKSGSFQALGGVEIVVEDNEMTRCNVAGEPLDDSTIYRLVTLDFLIDGGDSMNIGSDAIKIERTDLFVRDGVINYIKDKTAHNYIFDNKGDGRVKIIK
jgi:2',3'-cyclic-nucleotide 2'-phosphodiesterase (5'-nucleotidase family)